MVSDKTFREDLWFRINVFPILLPRLRDRPQDIPELARHFARRAGERFGLCYVEPTDRDLQMLVEYSWPGNIRELHAVIDRAAILGNGASLEIGTALGVSAPTKHGRPHETSQQRQTGGAFPKHSSTLPVASETLDQAMKRHIEQTLELTHGQIEGKNGAAAILDINPHTLRARMRKLKIDWKRFRAG
jgi:transcriptional regulator with GAF, ATPase, and Fis domain